MQCRHSISSQQLCLPAHHCCLPFSHFSLTSIWHQIITSQERFQICKNSSPRTKSNSRKPKSKKKKNTNGSTARRRNKRASTTTRTIMSDKTPPNDHKTPAKRKPDTEDLQHPLGVYGEINKRNQANRRADHDRLAKNINQGNTCWQSKLELLKQRMMKKRRFSKRLYSCI